MTEWLTLYVDKQTEVFRSISTIAQTGRGTASIWTILMKNPVAWLTLQFCGSSGASLQGAITSHQPWKMRSNKRYGKEDVDNAAVKWEGEAQMDRWLVIRGCCWFRSQLAGLSHLFILWCSVLKNYGSAGPASASLNLSAFAVITPLFSCMAILVMNPIGPFLRPPGKLLETHVTEVRGLGRVNNQARTKCRG